MAEYIEKDEIVAWILKQKHLSKALTILAIEETPAADVAPARHERWISVDADVIFRCSGCRAEVSTSWDYDDDDMFAYCPCCGAKMDGGENDGN